MDEQARLAAVRRLGVLDTPAEERFDVFTRLASTLCRAPISTVSLVDETRVWFKSTRGLPAGVRETPRDIAICAHIVHHPEPVMVVPDARLDPRFASSPLVTGPLGVRFYAGAKLTDASGSPLGALCVIDSKERAAEPEMLAALRELAQGVATSLRVHELSVSALKDALTGLGNRRLFDEGLANALAAAARDRRAVGLIAMDLDRFKTINDMMGHCGGDAVLREVAQRMVVGLREQDIAARLGGDEFCIVLPDLPVEDAETRVEAVAERVVRALRREPLRILDQRVAALLSAGYAVARPGEADPVQAAASLAHAADVALYNAKKRGRASVSRYSPALHRGIGSKRRLTGDLAAAIEADDDQLRVVFQPICRTGDRAIVGFEALVRWQHRQLGTISPGDFVPVAERTGLAAALDRRMLVAACREAAAWPGEPPVVAVNVTAHLLATGNVLPAVEAALAASGLPPDRLVVELTERFFLDETGPAAEAVTGLGALGVGVALDDFGAGHASFGYLKDIRFSKIKLDASLTRGLEAPGETAARGRSILRSVVVMGHELGLPVIAEAVETETQLALLTEAGCDALQGWLLGYPLPPAEWRAKLAPRPGAAGRPRGRRRGDPA